MAIFHVNFVIRNGSVAIPDSCEIWVSSSEIWVSTPCLNQIARRLHNRIYHPNCNATCLNECLSDGPLPFQIDLIFFLNFTISFFFFFFFFWGGEIFLFFF